MITVKRQDIAAFLRGWGLIFIIALIAVVATVIRPAFMSGTNILNILRAYSSIGVAAMGMTYVVIGGTMDLAIGSTISLSAVISMRIINGTVVDNYSPAYAAITALAVGILIGCAVGIINGGIIAAVIGRLGESFIITFAMQIVIAALALIVVSGEFQAAKYQSGLFKDMGIEYAPIIIFLIIVAIMQFFLWKSKFGRNLYFLGANMNAAKMAGIKIKTLRITAHTICGACAGLTGVLIASRVNSASPLQGVGYELDALAAVAVGGTSLAGGNGSVVRTMLGVLVIGVMLNALNIIGVDSHLQLVARGGVIILAVIMDEWNKRAKLRQGG